MFIKLREKKAFTLVEIMIVVAIIGLLVAIAVPNFVRARTTTRTNVCRNNLRIIEHAKEQWALDTNAGDTAAVVAADINGYIKGTTTALYCPLDTSKVFGTSYTINNVGTVPVCNMDTASPKTHTL